jgi:serine/threonine protein kinase
MALPAVLEATRAITEALRRLHDDGIVHGALQPGCVTLHDSGALLSQAAAARKTTPYSAPEQVEGKAPDSRSDIFAFGAIVYEMLSGRRAFPGEGQELRSAIVLQEPAALVGVPSYLARLVGRCLAKAPTQRWQRIQNVQMELKLLTVMARREEHVEESQLERLQSVLRKEVAPAVETLTARVSSIENATFEMRTKLAEESERWLAASQAVKNWTGSTKHPRRSRRMRRQVWRGGWMDWSE